MDQQLLISIDDTEHPLDVLRQAAARLEEAVKLLDEEIRQHQTRALNVELRRDSAQRRLTNLREWIAAQATKHADFERRLINAHMD